jgi:phage gp29-like protein
MRMEAKAKETIKVKDLTSGQKSKRVPSYTWINSMLNDSYNPDDLAYKDYQEMLRDPQIKAAERLITYSLLSKKFMVTPASEDPSDVEIADFVRDTINNMRTPFRMVRKDLYSAIPYGFAVSEINFKYNESMGRIVFESIMGIHIETIFENCFDYNEQGEVETVNQTTGTEKIPIPAQKCIIFAFDELFGNKYGNSILKACYDDHFMKHQILIWAAVFLEKHEGPTIVGYESETSGSDPDEMQKNIDSIHDGTAGFVGKQGEKYEILESQHRGEAFMQFINYHDNMIFRCFMIGSLLLGQAENQGGSYSQSQTHADTLNIFLDGVHMDLATSITERIRTLVDLNFLTESYPKFEFEPFTKKDLLALLSALQPLADKFMIDPSSEWFHQLLKRIMEEYADIEITEDMIENTQEFPVNMGEEEMDLENDSEEIFQGVKDILEPTTPE